MIRIILISSDYYYKFNSIFYTNSMKVLFIENEKYKNKNQKLGKVADIKQRKNHRKKIVFKSTNTRKTKYM